MQPLPKATRRPRLRFAAASLIWLLAFGPVPAAAQGAPVNGGPAAPTCGSWIDAKTGNPVPTTAIPASLGVDAYREYKRGTDPDHAYQSGQNFVRLPDGLWTDSRTGKPVETTTIPASLSVDAYRDYKQGTDPNHAYQSGQNFVFIPCPPQPTRIVDFPSAAQPADTIRLQVEGADASDASFWIDHRQLDATVVSSGVATVTVPGGFPLGPHELVLRSHDRESAVTIHIVNLYADQLATTQPGVVQTVTVHVEGLTPADAGTMYFKTADPAEFVSGKPIESAPVVDGVATTQIVGVHEGPAVIQFKLVVMPRPK